MHLIINTTITFTSKLQLGYVYVFLLIILRWFKGCHLDKRDKLCHQLRSRICYFFCFGIYGAFGRKTNTRGCYRRSRISFCCVSGSHCDDARKYILGFDLLYDAAHIGPWQLGKKEIFFCYIFQEMKKKIKGCWLLNTIMLLVHKHFHIKHQKLSRTSWKIKVDIVRFIQVSCEANIGECKTLHLQRRAKNWGLLKICMSFVI